MFPMSLFEFNANESLRFNLGLCRRCNSSPVFWGDVTSLTPDVEHRDDPKRGPAFCS